jgi:hypothetical protein
MAKTSGCALSGFVLVKKVPGSMHFLAKSPSHTFDHAAQNLSHVVNYFCARLPYPTIPCDMTLLGLATMLCVAQYRSK